MIISRETGSLSHDFEQLYLKLRKKEQRICSDEELAKLPDVPLSHPHYNEWTIRKRSAQKLVTYLGAKKKTLRILEVGCGNGWLSNKLAGIPASEVVGIDINSVEIEQAMRIFRLTNLQFVYGGIDDEIIGQKKFDVIIFAASVQYFSSFNDIINKALRLLNTRGEIHIIDSMFYKQPEVPAATERTADYYKLIGLSGMNRYYFHHSMDELLAFDHQLLYKPGNLFHHVLKGKSPFYWICIRP